MEYDHDFDEMNDDSTYNNIFKNTTIKIINFVGRLLGRLLGRLKHNFYFDIEIHSNKMTEYQIGFYFIFQASSDNFNLILPQKTRTNWLQLQEHN